MRAGRGRVATPPHKNLLCVIFATSTSQRTSQTSPLRWCSSRPRCALRTAPHAGTSSPPPRSRPWPPPSRASAPSRPSPPTRRLVGPSKIAPDRTPTTSSPVRKLRPPQRLRTARSYHIPRTGSNTFKGSLLNCCAGGCCACCCKMLCTCTLPARARTRAHALAHALAPLLTVTRARRTDMSYCPCLL